MRFQRHSTKDQSWNKRSTAKSRNESKTAQNLRQTSKMNLKSQDSSMSKLRISSIRYVNFSNRKNKQLPIKQNLVITKRGLKKV